MACDAADAARLRLKPSQPTYSNNECPSQEETTADRAKAGECTPTRVLVENEETIEEMVQRLERELDEEFLHLSPTTSAMATAKEAEQAPTAAQPDGWPDQRVPNTAVTEIEILEFENKQFTNSFVKLEVPSVPPDPTIHTPGWNGVKKVDEQPRQQGATEKRMAGAAEPLEQIVPSGCKQQRPPPT